MTTIRTLYPLKHRHGLLSFKSLYYYTFSILEKRRSRIALLALSDEQLKDVALSRADAYREAGRRLRD